MRAICNCLFVIFLVAGGSARADGSAEFRQVIGDSQPEYVNTLVVGRDGGVLVVGKYSNIRDGQVQALIFAADGELLGGDIMGGSGNQTAYGATQVEDGSYFVVADGPGTRKRTESYLLRYEADSRLVWSKTYYGAGGKKGKGSLSLRAIDAAPGGGAFLVGHAKDDASDQYDIILLHVDAAGEVTRESRYAIGDNAYGSEFFADEVGGGVVFGSAVRGDNPQPQLLMAHIGPQGELQSEKFLTDSEYGHYILDAVRFGDDQFVLLRFELNEKFQKVGPNKLIAVGMDGTVRWEIPEPENVTMLGIGTSGDGTIIAAGSVREEPENGKADAWLGAVGETGEFVWRKTYGAKRIDENARDIAPRNDGGSVIAGTVEGDVLVFTMSPEGEFPKR